MEHKTAIGTFHAKAGTAGCSFQGQYVIESVQAGGTVGICLPPFLYPRANP